MTARAIGLTIAASLTTVGAAALAGGAEPPPVATDRPAARTSAGTRQVLDVARAYALAARTWSAETYEPAWRREISLAAGEYRRALLQTAPTKAQVAALRADRAGSTATVVNTEARIDGARARVLVELDERTRSDGRTVSGITRNELLLRRVDGRWRVVGFTAGEAE